MNNIKQNNPRLSASLVCGDMVNILRDLRLLEKGGIDHLHFDVMDGHFVPRLGLLPEMLTAIKKHTNMPVDIHLMIENPEHYIPLFAQSPDDIIVVHAESTKHLDRMIRLIKDSGSRAGVALNPATPLNVLDYVIEDIDLVMLMAINPGIVGHKLIPQAIRKISDLSKYASKKNDLIIEIDGGVNFESAIEMIKAGANMLVCGTSTIYNKEKPINEKIVELRETIMTSLK